MKSWMLVPLKGQSKFNSHELYSNVKLRERISFIYLYLFEIANQII